MRTLFASLLIVTASIAAYCAQGVLEKVTKIQVEPTIVPPSANIKDPAAANLVRFNLRAAVKEAHFEEGSSPIRVHIILDQFGPADGKLKRVTNLGTGRTDNVVDGKLVIQDASGKQLAVREIHFRGNVGIGADGNVDAARHQPTTDFEQLLIDELQGLK